MHIVPRSFAVAALALCAAVAGLHRAAAQDCNWYARKALEQQKRNTEERCGLKGPEWNLDLPSHFAWCRNVSPQQWQQQAQLRDQLLAKCHAR